jgi:hypothetical protein
VDERGQLEKRIKREAADKVATKPTADGNIWKTFKAPDGSVTIHVYDRATGKFIEARPEIPRGKLPANPPAADAPRPESAGTPPATDPVPTTRVPERSPASSSHRELDLLTLATSYADAVSDLETAQAKLADTERLASKNVVSQGEVKLAHLAVAAAQRKEQLLQRIAKVALESVSKELKRASDLHEKGAISSFDAEEAQTRIEILKQILNTQPGN